jgi:periplasmic protein TonB
MFGVLLESRATRARRYGGAFLSVLVHASVIGAAIAVTVKESPAKPKCAPSPCDPFIYVRLVVPSQRVDRGTGPNSESWTSTKSTICSPCPIPIDFGNLSPVVPQFDFTDHGAAGSSTRDFCTRASECTFYRESNIAASAMGEEITHGPDLVARFVGSPPRPRYPEALRAAGLAGHVVVQFIVDTLGVIEPASLRVVESTHEQFARAVLEVLPRYRFVPAEASGHRVRMTAQMPFEFTLDRR